MRGAPETEHRRGPVDRLKRVRARVRGHRVGRVAWRSVITVLGVAVIAVGVVLLALPGPGWLVIFAGLGILASEFSWARRLLEYARDQVSRWAKWVAHQGRIVQALLGLVSLVFLGALAYAAWWVYAG